MTAGRVFLLICIFFASCETTKRVAVTSFRVIDAPARYIREHLDSSERPARTTTTTTTVTSDVTAPGHPVLEPAATPVPAPSPRHRATTPRPAATPAAPKTPRSQPSATPTKPTPRATPRPAPPLQFPVAKAVPGKPGFVYSPDPSGGIIDVTGYKSGDKAKDPYSGKIFVVP